MLGLCQSDTTDPATPKYTVCPCPHCATHAEEQCPHCGVIGPLSPPAASPSGSKEWQDLKPGDFYFTSTSRTPLEFVQIIYESKAYVSNHGHGQRALPDSMSADR